MAAFSLPPTPGTSRGVTWTPGPDGTAVGETITVSTTGGDVRLVPLWQAGVGVTIAIDDAELSAADLGAVGAAARRILYGNTPDDQPVAPITTAINGTITPCPHCGEPLECCAVCGQPLVDGDRWGYNPGPLDLPAGARVCTPCDARLVSPARRGVRIEWFGHLLYDPDADQAPATPDTSPTAQ